MNKKLISFVLTLLLVCLTAFSAVSAAPAEWQPEKQISPVELNGSLAYQIMLKANIGADNAAAPVICRVVKASDGFTGLNDSKIVYLDQAVADAYGNVSITFTVDQYGDFEANFRVMDGETSKAVPFTLLTKTEFEALLASAFAPGTDTAQVLQDNQEELNLDLTYFNKLKDDSAVLAELKAKQAQITPYNLAKILEEKTVLEYIKTADDKLDISKMLDRYEGKYLALSEQEWANIYATYAAMSDAEKSKAMQYLQSYAPATIDAIADDFNQSIIFAAISTMDKYALDKVVTDNNDLLGLTGYESLGTSQKSEFLGQLQAAALTSLNSVKAVYTAWKNPSPDGGGGGGGGGAISSPTHANPNIGAAGAVGAFGADTDLVKGEFPETLDIATSFLDLGDVSWAETAIRYLAMMEIVNGKGDRQFCPNDSITREEFIKIIVNAFDLYDKDATCSFTDVPADHWAHSYVASAVNNGLVFGVSDTEFGVGQNITREDMATLLYRMMVKLNTIERIKEFTYQFDDMDEVSTYAEYGVLMLYNGGYIQGSEGKFYPKNTATRAESAQMIYNIITGNINKPGQAEGGSAE